MSDERQYVLFYNPEAILRNLPCNAGIDAVLERLSGLGIRVVDTSRLNKEELQSAYIPAIMPSVLKKYRVRRIFGTRNNAGWHFGRGVPALVVQRSSDGRAEDVFLHEESGRIVTIQDALNAAKISS